MKYDIQNLVMKIDGIAGSSPKQVASDIVKLSKRLGVMVSTNFNGINMIATPVSSVNKILKEFEMESIRKESEERRHD